ncbi:phosphotransferase enzyme family protein [Neobacillus niacini]|uniref:phosphotransferase enzyme family protein n=1 Tax=Neobacillus niacini TaxID=86668 RepID=UPI0021CAFC6D|nr:phosphotransferase [Neobacillus niacini]MCM3766971.1 phosphotransferase [Neobacillus niacini]
MRENRIRLNGGFHNEVYYDKGINRVIRISEPGKTKDIVLAELQWMKFLYDKGVRVPRPDMSIDIEAGRVKTTFEYISGDPVDVTNIAHWNSEMFEQMGRILGRMHALSKECMVQDVNRPRWTPDNPDVFQIWRKLSPWLQGKYEIWMQRLVPYHITRDTFGLIHNDFHQGNLIVNEGGCLTVIDFDECSYNWYAQDLAVCFYHAYWQHASFNGDAEAFCKTFLSSFFKGYQEENLLHPDTVEQMLIFLKLREIFLYSLFLRKWDLDSLEDWQKFTLQDLEGRIEKESPYAGLGDFSCLCYKNKTVGKLMRTVQSRGFCEQNE